jgi:hypothetical protein
MLNHRRRISDSNRIDALLAKLSGLLLNSPEDIKLCPHTKASPELRMLVDEKLFKALTDEELLSYAILTGADQILFDRSEVAAIEFKRVFSELPIPVERSGYGCVRVIPPEEIIRKYNRFKKRIEIRHA